MSAPALLARRISVTVNAPGMLMRSCASVVLTISASNIGETTKLARASIDLVYDDQGLGCNLQLVVKVGSQSVQPTGSRYAMRHVETGLQSYTVRGGIACPTLGVCTASGSGRIDVAEGRSYVVSWLNTGIGSCEVSLNE